MQRDNSWRDGGAMVARCCRVAAVAAPASLPFCYQFGIEYAALALRYRMSKLHVDYEPASC